MSSNRSLVLFAALAGSLGLTACASGTRIDAAGDRVPVARTPTEQFKVATEERPDVLLFAAHDAGLSAAQSAAAADFARLWAERGSSDVMIEGPTAGGNPAFVTSHAAAEAMMRQGVPAEAIHIVGYDAPATAPVRISFSVAEAQQLSCNESWGRLSATGKNQPYANFGCVTKANLAAMIANPADIDHPRAMQPADAARRQAVLDKYREGDITSSKKDDQASGVVAKAVQ